MSLCFFENDKFINLGRYFFRRTLMLYTVRGLKDKVSGITIRLRVLSVREPRIVKTRNGEEHEVVDIQVGDRTGSIFLTLWDERTREVKIDDLIDVSNGYVNRFRGRLKLNIGMFGEMEKVEDPEFPSREDILEILRRRRERWKKRKDDQKN
jgi:replication factor A1